MSSGCGREIKKIVLSSLDDKSFSSTEEEEVEAEQEVVDDDSVHDISDYLHLVDTLHYNKEEDSVYKPTRVAEDSNYIVVYRNQQVKNGQWARSEFISLIFAKDVVEMNVLSVFRLFLLKM